MRCQTWALAGALVLGAAAPSFAHITLETAETVAGSTYKAVLRVGHGCEGSPTTSIRVQIPEGVIAVKPMPKPGWELETKIAPYETPVQYFEQTLTEGVQEISWTGGSLPDDRYDEFVFRGRMPDTESETVVRFPVVQTCETGEHRWIEIPAEDQNEDVLEEPAPGVRLVPAAAE